ERGGALFLRDEAGRRLPLRLRGDTLVTEGRLAVGRRLLPVTGGPGADALVTGTDTLLREETPPPAPIPAPFAPLVGEYGWDHNVLYVLEEDRRLHLLIEWFFQEPLEAVGADSFRLPDRGLYAGERVVFVRDAAGRPAGVRVGGVLFPRRAVGPGEGVTFRITPVRPVAELRREALAARPPRERGPFREPDLVELRELDPTIRYDIRYAGTDNFMADVFYTEPHAFLQRPAAEAVVRAHRALAPHGYGLLIHDAYRPWHVTKMFWDATPDSLRGFVADPAGGSRHNRGAAVDLTLYDLATGEPLLMPSGYDEFTPRAFADYPGGTHRQRWLRELLRDAMEAEGFDVYPAEWWHFDFRDWRRYPLLNRTFETLEGN
ncbi:MAG TPA: M15 family metallopeptidase, partial [Longimicrobiales bacterium]|nr:M15 family metallopeptidase [Longimicrobiales bacterium]